MVAKLVYCKIGSHKIGGSNVLSLLKYLNIYMIINVL